MYFAFNALYPTTHNLLPSTFTSLIERPAGLDGTARRFIKRIHWHAHANFSLTDIVALPIME
jgi:hypothetical protein